MSNSYFRFKQFIIEQDRCAMKVTTDACIFGAWLPVLPSVSAILDIGAGTGLLSLMLAQRAPRVAIDGIELDTDAAQQATENISASPWQERVSVLQGDVRGYPFSRKYDLIVSNPPFFNNSLLGDRTNKNMARHTLSLSYEDLLTAIDANLNGDGYAAIILPANEYIVCSALLAKHNWQEKNRLLIKHTPIAKAKRVVCVFSRNAVAECREETLIIKDEEGNYAPAFTQLLMPYYLDLQENK